MIVVLLENVMIISGKLLVHYMFLKYILYLIIQYVTLYNICREKRALMLNEISLRRKVLHDKNFPNQELIEEFLYKKDLIPSKLDIGWKQPQVYQFIVNILLHIHYKIVFLLNILLNIYNLFLGFYGETFMLGTTICI